MSKWISVDDAHPEWVGKSTHARVLCATNVGHVMEMSWSHYPEAATLKGRKPRWEWNGRISPFKVTHWMPLPEPPKDA